MICGGHGKTIASMRLGVGHTYGTLVVLEPTTGGLLVHELESTLAAVLCHRGRTM